MHWIKLYDNIQPYVRYVDYFIFEDKIVHHIKSSPTN